MKKLNKKLRVLAAFGLLLFLPTMLHAAEMTMTLYYPSLSGDYDQVRFLPRSSDLTDPCTIGTLYVNSNNVLQYCHDNSGSGQWGSVSDVWEQNSDDIYLPDTTLKVGIGTKTPEFKLSLSTDSGIIAKGTFGSGETLPDGIGAGSRLIWYPRKAAFRAGYVSGSQWDDANIGIYSAAFGKDSTASGSYSLVGGGDSNVSSGQYSLVLGGQNNTASGVSTVIGGGQGNLASGQYATILGGKSNSATADFTTIAGGHNNSATAIAATIGGGGNNNVSTPYSNINGGKDNSISGTDGYSVIGGGNSNLITNDYSTISGGQGNWAKGLYSSIGGGQNNNNPSM